MIWVKILLGVIGYACFIVTFCAANHRNGTRDPSIKWGSAVAIVILTWMLFSSWK